VASRKICIGCGKPMPKRGAVNAGWTITRLCADGLGSRWYRQCGCLHWREYGTTIRALFHAGQDLPHSLCKEMGDGKA